MMFKFSKLAAVALIAIAAAHGAASAEDKPDPVVAKVGGVEIRQSEIDLAMAGLDPQLANLPPEQKKVAALFGHHRRQAARRRRDEGRLDERRRPSSSVSPS